MLWHLLAQKARHMGFDVMPIRLLLGLYSASRAPLFESMTIGDIRPLNGAVAGCSFADLMTRSCAVPILGDVAA